jgi:tRNA threonylcarbamoyladenosine biosynthesis protein TsaE
VKLVPFPIFPWQEFFEYPRLVILVVVCAEARVATMTREITTHSAEETIAFGRTLAEMLAPPKLVLLRGDLGAGKTTLVKGIAAAFEAAEEEDVTSPTFTLVHEYRGPRANLYHIDLYRIDTQRELETLGLDDLRTENSILLIEWGEKFPRFVRERDVEIALERDGESGRRIRVRD